MHAFIVTQNIKMCSKAGRKRSQITDLMKDSSRIY